MARKRILRHPSADLFQSWAEEEAGATRATYASDVARFLRSFNTRRLAAIDEGHIKSFLEKLPSDGSRRRMLSALGSFFQYARDQRAMLHDPLWRLKYRRQVRTSSTQLNLLDLLIDQGVSTPRARSLVWADFVAPLVSCPPKKGLRLGGSVRAIRPTAWEKLQSRFCQLAGHGQLTMLLKKKIA